MMGGARGGGEGEEAEDQAGSDEDVPGSSDPVVRLVSDWSHHRFHHSYVCVFVCARVACVSTRIHVLSTRL